MAYDKGVSKEELIEFLEVAMTMQGCPGEERALKAYATFKEWMSGRQPADALCCAH